MPMFWMVNKLFGNFKFSDNMKKIWSNLDAKCKQNWRVLMLSAINDGDLKSDHLKSENIKNPNFLKAGFQTVPL